MFEFIKTYFLIFLIYSILGWILEVIRCYMKYKKFIYRGFLLGPYCPIYGIGALLVLLFYSRYAGNVFVVYMFSFIDAGILEFYTSYFMEKIFHARWWDYSDRKFNVDGRICLENLVGFGFLSLLILYIFTPALLIFISIIPNLLLDIIFYTSFICVLADFVLSYHILLKIRNKFDSITKDNTEEIREIVIQTLKEKSWKYKRLLLAYPNVRYTENVNNKKIQAILASSEPTKVKKIKINSELQKIELNEQYKLTMQRIEEKTKRKLRKIKDKK